MENSKIEKKFNEWNIHLELKIDSIIINISKNNSLEFYQNSYTLEDLKKINFFLSKNTLNEIFDSILEIIDLKKIQIEIKEGNIHLILFSATNNNIKANLMLKEKSESNKKLLEILLNKIYNLEKNNEKLEQKVENLINDNKKLQEKIENLEKNENNNTQKIVNGIQNKKKYLTDCNLKKINSISFHDQWIRALSVFPISGNILSSSNDKSIIIYGTDFNIIQKIINAHDNEIIDLDILDENNFISCSNDKNIKIWIKRNLNISNKFEFNLYYIINNAHNAQVNKVIYYNYGKIISCGCDYKINIWEEYNNNNNINYQLITTLSHSNVIYSILLLEDKSILISSGIDGIKFWNFNNFNNIKNLDNVWGARNALKRFDNDKIIIGSTNDDLIRIFSISEMNYSNFIHVNFFTWGICVVEDKNLILICGKNKNINVYRKDNFECIQIINDAHGDFITGVVELKDGSIASFGKDSFINIWSF